MIRRKVYRRRWYEKNRVEILERQKAYQKANPDKVRAARQRYAERHPEKIRAHHRRKNWLVQGCPEPTRPEPTNCECCGRTETKALALDHCHTTGAFRGWLCSRCNLAIGKLGDTAEGVKMALEYLNRAIQ